MTPNEEEKLNYVAVLGTVVAVVFAGFVWFAKDAYLEIKNARASSRDRFVAIEKDVETLKTKAEEDDRQTDRNEKRLERIEAKLDRVLERMIDRKRE